MKLMLTLIRWQLRQLILPNCVVACIAVLFALLSPSAITFFQSPFAMSTVLVHCGVMVLTLGRSEPRGPGFLYAQGFSRDQLWWSTFAATLCSGLFVCTCFWLVVATGFRAVVQQAIGNPWFPLAGTLEVKYAKWFLLEYALLLPPMHYVWVRARQPQRDAAAGWMLALGIIGFYSFCLMNTGPSDRGSVGLQLSFAIVLASLTLIGSWRFHRQVEVQS